MIRVAKPSALFLLMVTAMVTSGNVLGQDNLEVRLLACDAHSDVGERMDCFNALVDSIRPDADVTETSPTNAPTNAVEPDSATAAAARTATSEAGEAVAATSATVAAVEVSGAVESAPAEAAGSPVESVSAHEETTMTVDVIERGYEPVEQNPLEDAPLPSGAQIVEVWTNSDGRFSVRLDNGQVWRETQGSRVGKPKVGRSIEVVEGRFGGERMRIEGIRRLAWVRRTE